MSNLTSQYLALGNRRGLSQTMGTCLRAFFLLLLPLGALVTWLSDPISVELLGDARTQLGLILLVPCVALTGVENLHKHFFYGAGLVRPPAIVELVEQFIRTAAVLGTAALLSASVSGAGGRAYRPGDGDLRGILRLHPVRPVPPSVRPFRAERAGGNRPNPPEASALHCPACRGQRPAGQPDGSGQRHFNSPEAGRGRDGAVGGHLRIRCGLWHDHAHALPSHCLSGHPQSGPGPPSGSGLRLKLAG